MRRCCRSCSTGTWRYASGLEGRDVFHRFADLMRERVEPDQAIDVEQAALLADESPELGAAVMSRHCEPYT